MSKRINLSDECIKALSESRNSDVNEYGFSFVAESFILEKLGKSELIKTPNERKRAGSLSYWEKRVEQEPIPAYHRITKRELRKANEQK